eukprot:TRINITY_DN8713_c0_g1_i1.p1 TRINITY_DN8713_c0_g1~~TRINITY_DN8713_c0_g1_i1.p1  ORF type:complete len:223 (-),score=30.80 TRINITY_DN8713_c0_g1_i1:112-780(-)
MPSSAPVLSADPLASTEGGVSTSKLPTCYYLAATSTQAYDGEFEWVIELENGWKPWMPENRPFQGSTDAPLAYSLGRYEFEVHFESEVQGTQTNLTTGKVRRIQRIQKGDPLPAWEGTGTRRRAAHGSGDVPSAPVDSAAVAAQSRRAVRRSPGGYPGSASAEKLSLAGGMNRPRVSQTAHAGIPVRSTNPERLSPAGGTQALPRYMRPLKSKAPPASHSSD